MLELGAGTGRIALGIAQDGVAIHALDSHPAMLDALRRKVAEQPADVQARVTVVAGDMRTFRLPERFALIIAPFRAFLHNTSADDQLACLRRVREHLQPRGSFAFNVFHPSLQYMAQNWGALGGVWRSGSTVEKPDGGCVVLSEANRYDTVRQIVYSQHRYDEYGADGVLARTFLQRLELAYLYPGDIRRLLMEAGFGSVRITGGFEDRPFAHDGDELVVEATAE